MASNKIVAERFSEAVCQELGNYVYRLIDPRNGETFYVGKGKNNRVFEHVEAAIEIEEAEDQVSIKLSRIHEIRRAGLEVVHVVHRHAITDAAIFEVEAALIDAFGGLANIAGGHGSGDRGPMHARQIIDKYDLPVIDWEPTDKLLLINVNNFRDSGDDALYEHVRSSWRISQARAEKADYVLAVVRGVVLGAFKPLRWGVATTENFPGLKFPNPDRLAFQGHRASKSVWSTYCGERGKRIALDELRHVQNPVRYWNV